MKLGKLPIAWKKGTAQLNLGKGTITKTPHNVYILKNTPKIEKVMFSLPKNLKKEWKGGGPWKQGGNAYYVGEPIVRYIRRLK